MTDPEVIQRWDMGAPLTKAEFYLLSDPSIASATRGFDVEHREQLAYLRIRTSDVHTAIGTFFGIGKAALSTNDFLRALGGYGLALRAHISGFGLAHPNTATLISWVATSLRYCGDLSEALALQRAIVEDNRWRPRDPLGNMMARATLAHMLLDANQPAPARALLEAVLKEAILHLGADAPFTLSIRSDLVTPTLHLGDTQFAMAHAVAAESGLRSESSQPELAQLVAQSNLANVYFEREDFATAKRLEEDCLEKFRALVGPEHHRTLTAEHNLAVTLKRLRELDRAESLARHAVETLIRRHGLVHPETLRSLDNQLSIWWLQDTPQRGLPFAVKLLPMLGEVASFGRILFRLASRLAVCVGETIASLDCAWEDRELALRALDAMPAASSVLCEEAQLLSFDTDEIALDDFLAFHDWWSKIAALNRPSMLLQAVAPLHGIHAWSSAADCLQDTSMAVPAIQAQRREFIAARDALNHLRSQLAAAWSERHRGIEETQVTSVLLERERNAIARFRNARIDLSTVDASFAALSFHDIYAQLPHISDWLQPDEILVLTLSLGRAPNAPSAALVQRSDGRSVLMPLPGFGDLAGAAGHASRRLGSGMRGGGTGDRGVGQAAPSQSLAELRGSINAAFWQPLCYALTRLHVCPTAFTSLHVVTAPMHHSIPLESANEDFPAFYYCGLPAFVRLRRRERSDPTASSALLAYDVAWSTAQPIPFVRAEAQLAEVVLACKGTVEQAPLDELPHRSAARLLLIGCHGDVGGTAQGRHGTLLLDAQTNRSMSTYEGTAIGAKYEEIIVSSCLAGLVGKARWGDALGLVPLWQTCSVATVVACVAPVHDFYMPLLTTLYLHHRLHRTESSVALRRAKSELLSGEWPEPFCQAVRVVYRSEMEHVLTRGAQGQHTDVCARIALGWPLVSAVKDELRNHLLDADKGNAALRALFSSVSARNAWIDAGLTALIDERWSRATSADPVHHMIRTALEHICAYTVCYGGSSAMYGKQ